ncbi:TPA: phage tail protein [Klebsiella pneumoniae]|uniref:phage tail protein n=1 Tax=Klebsiella pneumoniae complex TaxID=3390273 RepID=UPI000E2D18CD|nr:MULTISPECIES: phage tail protein [Klebsiella]MBX8480292.1 phage tail protein [Klebsiella quasipneumoniae subsp. similipneumoniae]MBX9413669.1 phage tail protein [Klebsiella quasipneumoniae subsp. similipneumoniae]MBX9416430.1 phage tail protein [Klebsiella quasipneumoniae subsp. similipneumoniae]SWP63241.1 Tail fiber protein [Klebsiella pneumoniae]SXW54204.1 Tail fiber protein [Klebsiella pneumoniae]
MEKVYQAILTEKGRDKLAAAAITGEQVGFTMMGVGDGGGQSAAPLSAQDSLINELYRASLNRLVIADQAANVIRAEMVMQPQVGGFWLREAGLYDDAGDCLAVANLPPSYKPMLAEGAGRLQAINLWIAVSNTADVQLMTDPTVIIASVDEVTRAKNEAKDYTDEVLGALDTNIKQIIAEAVKTAVSDAWELDNPVGTTRFFNQNLNPNERWPWSEWVYTGENRTIRVGKADGSNVGATGGSDTVTLQRNNLPAVQIDVSGETSEQIEQKLTTTKNGKHNHGGVAGKDDPWEIGGDVRQLFNPKELGVTDDAGEHEHEVTVPAHKHTTSGKTANLGEDKSFSVVEAHTLLMCWSRVA